MVEGSVAVQDLHEHRSRRSSNSCPFRNHLTKLVRAHRCAAKLAFWNWKGFQKG